MIVTYGNQVLREKSEPITFPITNDIDQLLMEMTIERKKHKNAVGLAAPQVGCNVRLIMVRLVNGLWITMFNPQITSWSEQYVSAEEGCLSIPDVTAKVKRSWEIVVEYQDENGILHSLELNGLDAACVQHEIDHLNGYLFTDYLTGGQKKRVDKKLSKLSKGI